MGVNSLPKTVTRQRRDCDLNQGPTAPESSTLTTRLPSHASIGANAQMRAAVTDVAGSVVCLFVCLLVTNVSRAKTESIYRSSCGSESGLRRRTELSK